MRYKTSGCLITLLLLGLIVSLGLNFGLFLGKLNIDVDAQAGLPTARPKKKLHESVVQSAAKSSRDKIVHIDLDGIITSVKADGFLGQAMPGIDKVKRSLEQAMEDASVKAIVLRINSPGGEVTASDVLYNAVKKAAKVKPVVVYMDAMAASGGYYVSCGATKIVAAETTLTASIGVIMETLNYSELFGKVGLSMNTFTSGAFKDSLSGARPMRDDEKAYVQNLVTQMYERFLGIVSEARGVPKETLKSTVADGRVVTGREALKAKLVDQIGYVEDAYTLARELGKAPDAGVVKYRNETNFFEILAAASTATPPSKVQVEVGGGLLPQLQPGMLYYLPPGYAR